MNLLRSVRKKTLTRLALLFILLSGLICTLWHYNSKNEFQQVARADSVYKKVNDEDSTTKFFNYSTFATLESFTTAKVEDTGSPWGGWSKNVPGPTVEEAVHQCMAISNFDRSVNLSLSQTNARYLYDEYRKVVPEQSLDGHLSHCWRTSCSVQWSGSHVVGHVGNRTFEKTLQNKSSKRKLRAVYSLSRLSKSIPAMKFKSDTMCLPNVFLAGFPKCGSSYLYCVVERLIDFTTKRPGSFHSNSKEPHFWVSDNHDVHVPTADNLLWYFLEFLPGLQKTASYNQSQTLLVDGSPNMFFKWPRFREFEENLTNYCLIPSVLPNLLPHSKYIVIMRNPVNMMYSAFWFSCTSLGNLPMSVQLRGPHLFHERVQEKVTMFNNCMRDTTVPALNYTCPMDSKDAYGTCILRRLHLLDKCIHQITFNNFSPELPGCGRTRLAMGVYYAHIRKWLRVISKERFLFLTLEDLVKDANVVMRDILKFLGLSSGNGFDSMARRIQHSCNTNSQSSVDYKKDPRLSMTDETKRLLNIFFHPFNQLLSNLTNRTNIWNA